MTALTLEASSLAIRDDLVDAHRAAWATIAAPGTWLDGGQRLAVAAEVRHARRCDYCARSKAALSPTALAGVHQSLGALAPAQVELIHRVVSDPGRLTERWTETVLAQGLANGSDPAQGDSAGGDPEGTYVEVVGIIAMVMIMDTFTRALGLPPQPLPAAATGVPARYRPPGAKKQAAWLPLVEPQDAVASDGALYPNPKAGYIYRALSLVPQSVRDYWALANMHYIPGQFVYQFDKTIRAITRPQTEILAARVSALHQCSY